jgi:hypothetical protein
MALPATFVGFSSTDINYYWLMRAWKENEKIDFDFRDCQLHNDINSNDEDYVKRKCRQRILMASKFIQLIGKDTRFKYKYVRWEAEVAIEKGCTIIGVNLDGARQIVEETCPPIINNIGAIFAAFSPKIIKYTLENYEMKESGNYYYKDEVYKKLGYDV